MIKTGKDEKLYKTYSDDNMYIQKDETGELYVIAYDVKETQYTETDIPIPEVKEYKLNNMFELLEINNNI